MKGMVPFYLRKEFQSPKESTCKKFGKYTLIYVKEIEESKREEKLRKNRKY